MKSLLQTEKEDYFTKETLNLDKHHIFGGPFRNKSESYGMYVYLTHARHMELHSKGTNVGMGLYLKKVAQSKFEEIYSHDDFMRIFKKNYL